MTFKLNTSSGSIITTRTKKGISTEYLSEILLEMQLKKNNKFFFWIDLLKTIVLNVNILYHIKQKQIAIIIIIENRLTKHQSLFDQDITSI